MEERLEVLSGRSCSELLLASRWSRLKKLPLIVSKLSSPPGWYTMYSWPRMMCVCSC